jgi:hypothetical protein
MIRISSWGCEGKHTSYVISQSPTNYSNPAEFEYVHLTGSDVIYEYSTPLVLEYMILAHWKRLPCLMSLFLSRDLGDEATLLLTLDSQSMPGLYNDYFPTAWQSSPGSKCHIINFDWSDYFRSYALSTISVYQNSSYFLLKLFEKYNQ